MVGLSFEGVFAIFCHNYLRVLIVKANLALGALLKRIILLASCVSRREEFDH